MSTLTDSLTHAQDTLLASGREMPATDLRTFTSMLIAAIGGLEQRARGNRIFYTIGKPSDNLGLEGDMGVNTANGDFYGFTDGIFKFLFNGKGKEGVFTAIAQNAFGIHPAFTTQKALDEWLLSNVGSSTTPTITAPAAPTALMASPRLNSILVTATAPANNGGAAITGYDWLRATVVNGTASVFSKVGNSAGLTFLDTTTANDATLYQYRSQAVNSMGASTASAPTTSLASFNAAYTRQDPNISTANLTLLDGVQLRVLLTLPLSTNSAPNPAQMLVYADVAKQNILAQFDYNGADTGVACGIEYTTNGTTTLYLKTLTNGDVTLS